MLVVFSASHRDYSQAVEHAEWCVDLGPYPGHRALVVASSTLPDGKVTELVKIFRKAKFMSVDALRLRTEDSRGWPYAPNEMFKGAVEWVRQKGVGHWLWTESDSIPMAEGWIDKLEDEYRQRATPFLGALFDKPFPHLNGVMIYPENVASFNRFMVNAQDRSWDLTACELTLQHGKNTDLIQRMLADPTVPKGGAPMTFPTQDSLRVIRPGVLLFHGCKDGSLIKRLKEQRGDHVGPNPFPKTAELLRKAVKRITGMSSYYHSGSLGDIIYSLNAIRLHGGGDLLLGPQQIRTSPCAHPISRDQFELLTPLLRAQPYLKRIEFRNDHPRQTVEHDLNHFRNHWHNARLREETKINNLCAMHCHQLGVSHLFDPRDPWLTVSEPIWTGKIIVHRSSRHRGKLFPWAKLSQKYADQMLFVGLPDEHTAFQIEQRCKVSFYQTRDFLELARVIKGGQAFVGNQSLPMAIALGVGQRVFQEAWPTSPDCLFERQGFITQLAE